MNVSSRQLQAFLEITELHSFAKAAERIHLSASGMSMLVKELEEQVGARLFDRTTRAVILTDAGRRLQPVAERFLSELRGLSMALNGSEEAVRARLDLAATPMVSATLLPDVIGKFELSHPHITVHLEDVDVATVQSKVLGGEVDFGLGFFVKPAVGLQREPICKFRLMRISPPKDSKSRKDTVPWDELTDAPLLSLRVENPIQALIEKHLPRTGRAQPLQRRTRHNLIGTIMAMVRAGRGHAVIPSFAMDECRRQNLGVSLLTDPPVYLELFLVSRRGAELKASVTAFTETLKQAAAHMSD
ncbi:LysR family transcriptional regulator [Pseudomonas sp. R5(2019)]|nr:LysR family transcriptional regulator [Pseudomonas sp. R5(2019)]